MELTVEIAYTTTQKVQLYLPQKELQDWNFFKDELLVKVVASDSALLPERTWRVIIRDQRSWNLYPQGYYQDPRIARRMAEFLIRYLKRHYPGIWVRGEFPEVGAEGEISDSSILIREETHVQEA